VEFNPKKTGDKSNNSITVLRLTIVLLCQPKIESVSTDKRVTNYNNYEINCSMQSYKISESYMNVYSVTF